MVFAAVRAHRQHTMERSIYPLLDRVTPGGRETKAEECRFSQCQNNEQCPDLMVM